MRGDVVARRMLAALLRLENAPWPGALRAYGAMLVALSTRCERPEAKAEIYHWFDKHGRGVLIVYGARRRECLTDAFHEAVARAPGLLLRFRTGLRPDRPPNLQSMLARWIVWRSKGLYESLYRRHDARHSQGVDALLHLAEMPASDDPEATVIAAEVCARLTADGSPRARGLLLVGAGHTVAEAARKTGASRQQIYGARGDLIW